MLPSVFPNLTNTEDDFFRRGWLGRFPPGFDGRISKAGSPSNREGEEGTRDGVAHLGGLGTTWKAGKIHEDAVLLPLSSTPMEGKEEGAAGDLGHLRPGDATRREAGARGFHSRPRNGARRSCKAAASAISDGGVLLRLLFWWLQKKNSEKAERETGARKREGRRERVAAVEGRKGKP